MMEDELRRAMDAEVGPMTGSRERLYRAQLEAGRRRHRKDMTRLSVVSGVLGVVAVVGFAGLLNPTSSKTNGTTGPQTVEFAARVEASNSAAETSGKEAVNRPAVLVGAAASGRLVRIDSATGKTASVITVVHDPNDDSKGGLLGHVALSADAKTVYFDALTADACQPEIRSVAVSGGPVATVTKGSAPTVSSDGKTLAFVRKIGCDQPQVFIRSLAYKNESLLGDAGKNSAIVDVADLAWAPNNAGLAADLRYQDQSMDHVAVRDPSGQDNEPDGWLRNLADWHTLSPDPSSRSGTVLEWPSYLPDGRMFVSERCCAADGGTISDQTSRMIIVDPHAQQPSSLIAFGLTDRLHASTVADGTGNYLLYVSGQDLMVSDNGARPATLARGLLGATWR